LIHDITREDFSDIYAETIAYGMFAARLHDKSPETFSREEALELLPKSNPFLRSLFSYVAGPDLDDRLKWVVDELAQVFQAANVHDLMDGFGKLTGKNDPFLHFYETFLAAYNPEKRKARGVWYTPEPVVAFIVRAVDEVLQKEFGLSDGLADTSKVLIDWDTGQTDKKGKRLTVAKEVHRVQILDPATGTGTFLAEVIKRIAPRVREAAEGMWSGYIEKELIPRLHGFELLMASYAMCHMKLDMILTALGYKPTGAPPRLSVYLTNSLEEGQPANQTLPFAQWLSNEVKQANAVKRDMPIMCILGNPPYSGHSSNKGTWINGLMDVYKQSPELKKPAQAKWLSDDYVKFIRFSEHLIEKNGEGVLGFISNHGYLDNPTFLDMRSHLMATFDTIYVIDLHGNAKKKEVSPDGTADKNVFDIQQGVAIIVAAKKRAKKNSGPAKVLHYDLWGSRESKYEWLDESTLSKTAFVEVTPTRAPWIFVPQDRPLLERYERGFSVADLFSLNGRPAPGIVTTHDEFAISNTSEEAQKKVRLLVSTSNEAEARSHFRLCTTTQWNYARAKLTLKSVKWEDEVVPVNYRPFDKRFTVYNPNVAVHRRERVMNNFVNHDNLGLLVTKGVRDNRYAHVFISKIITEAIFLSGATATNAMNLPLYLYPSEQDLDKTRKVNFDGGLYSNFKKIAAEAGRIPDEVAVFDYVYGVLHCPEYRKTYSVFLKSDFPRVPWPNSSQEFWDVSQKGGYLRRLHLLEAEAVGSTPFPFKGDGDNIVTTPRHEGDKVWISATQYFDNVPAVSWPFYIGGYQPAQKWLKDRKGDALSFEDIKHYQRILKVLAETDRIMQTITLSSSG
jgi:predicted helicase